MVETKPPEGTRSSPVLQSPATPISREKAIVRPKDLIYAVDEWPPLRRLLLLGFQFAVLDAVYLVIVVIIVRHAHVPPEVAVNVVSHALIASAIAMILQAIPIGPIGSGFLAPPVDPANLSRPVPACRGGRRFAACLRHDYLCCAC